MNEKQRKILTYLKKHIKGRDPSGKNMLRYTKLFGGSEISFKRNMELMRSGKIVLDIIMPNLYKPIPVPDLMAWSKDIGLEVFERIWMVDPGTNVEFLTPNKYIILDLPIRRQEQFHDKKLRVPDDDSGEVDSITGQVTGATQATRITGPETQALITKGLTSTLEEILTVRGGNATKYSDIKRSLEDVGSAEMDMMEHHETTTSVVVADLFLKGMHIDSNLQGE